MTPGPFSVARSGFRPSPFDPFDWGAMAAADVIAPSFLPDIIVTLWRFGALATLVVYLVIRFPETATILHDSPPSSISYYSLFLCSCYFALGVILPLLHRPLRVRTCVEMDADDSSSLAREPVPPWYRFHFILFESLLPLAATILAFHVAVLLEYELDTDVIDLVSRILPLAFLFADFLFANRYCPPFSHAFFPFLLSLAASLSIAAARSSGSVVVELQDLMASTVTRVVSPPFFAAALHCFVAILGAMKGRAYQFARACLRARRRGGTGSYEEQKGGRRRGGYKGTNKGIKGGQPARVKCDATSLKKGQVQQKKRNEKVNSGPHFESRLPFVGSIRPAFLPWRRIALPTGEGSSSKRVSTTASAGIDGDTDSDSIISHLPHDCFDTAAADTAAAAAVAHAAAADSEYDGEGPEICDGYSEYECEEDDDGAESFFV